MPVLLLPLVGLTGLGVGWFGGAATSSNLKTACKYAAIAGVAYIAYKEFK